MSVKFELLEAMVPEAIESLKRRCEILNFVAVRQPVGRRAVAYSLNRTERKTRADIDFLCERGFVSIEADGVSITVKGRKILRKLDDIMKRFSDLNKQEESLAKALGIRKVIIARGDIDADEIAFDFMAKMAARYIADNLFDNDRIAVTGGTTLKRVVELFDSSLQRSGIRVIPGRGGIGTDIKIQSNTIAAALAHKLHADSDTLYLPDMLGEMYAKTLMQEPNIKKIMDELKNVNMLVFGIGVAEEMAVRRGFSDEIIRQIEEKGAVGEAFGYYFNQEGDIVYSAHTIGISIDDMKGIERLIGVAGGGKKARAIISVVSNMKNCILITDKGAAEEMCRLLAVKI